jgi:hypothetical protein
MVMFTDKGKLAVTVDEVSREDFGASIKIRNKADNEPIKLLLDEDGWRKIAASADAQLAEDLARAALQGFFDDPGGFGDMQGSPQRRKATREVETALGKKPDEDVEVRVESTTRGRTG